MWAGWRATTPIAAATLALTLGLTACDSSSEKKPAARKTAACAPAAPSPSAKIPSKTIYVNIVNAGEKPGLAGKTQTQLSWRGFNILDVGNQSLMDDTPVPKYAEVRYGKGARQIALTLAKQVQNATVKEVDDRTNLVVDLVLGEKFALVPVPPPPANQVSVNVYNTTATPGLSGTVAQQMRERGFKVLDNNNDPKKAFLPDDVAVIRHGERGEPAARRVAAQVAGAKLMQDSREDTTIDLVLAAKFKDLLPVDQAKPKTPATPKSLC